MIREIAGSSLCERVCDRERERDSSPFQTLLHKMCVNVKHFWGKPIRNIDSSPPAAELNGKSWPLDSSLVSDQVSKQRTVVHFQQCISTVYLTTSLALTKQCRSHIGLKQSRLATQRGRT